MLPFNESCFRVLHSIMVKKKAIHKSHCTQLHSSASALLVFSVQESKKGGDFKEQPTRRRQHQTIKQFETLPKRQASSFAIGRRRLGGESWKGLVGHVKRGEKNGAGGIERRKGARGSWGG